MAIPTAGGVAIPPFIEAQLPPETWGGWALTQIGSAVDGAVLEAMRLAVDAALMPAPHEIPRMRASAQRFVDGELWDDARRYFPFVDRIVEVSVSARPRRNLDGGSVVAREFRMSYRPSDGGEAPGELRVPVEHWVHERVPSRTTVLALHGFSMGYPRLDAFALFAGELYRQGFDVALQTLPHHGVRTPTGDRFSGEHFAVPEIERLNEAVRQAVYEIHAVAGWFRNAGGTSVGLLGLSLGGYLTSLMAGLTPELGFVIPMVPPVCIGDLAWRFFARSRRYRGDRAPAFSREELRAAYRVHSPLTFPLLVPRERVLIIAGRGDRIVPPEHPYALWRHWQHPEIHWFSGSHLAPFRRGALVRRIVRHIEDVL